MQFLVLDRVEHLLEEAAHQHAFGLGLGDAAAHQVEHRVLVERTDSGAVAADHVVGEDFELGLRQDFGFVRQHQALHHQLGVGLLRVSGNHDLALERRFGAATCHLLEQRLAGAVGHRMRQLQRHVRVLTLDGEVQSGEVAMRALAFEAREEVHPAQRRADVNGHGAQLAAGADMVLGGGEIGGAGPAQIKQDVGQLGALADCDVARVVVEVRLVAARKRLDHRRLATVRDEQMDAVVHVRRFAFGAAVDMHHLRGAAADFELQRLCRERAVEPDQHVVTLGQRRTLADGGAHTGRHLTGDVGDAVGHRNAMRAGDAQRRLAHGRLGARQFRHRAQQHLQVGIVVALDLAGRQADGLQPLGSRGVATGVELGDQRLFGGPDPHGNMHGHAAASSKPA